MLYFLENIERNEHMRLKVLRERGRGHPHHRAVYQGADWGERFVWDFYGVCFAGGDKRRMLIYEEFKGHALRKDYPLRGRQRLIPERPIKDIFRGPGTNGVQRLTRPSTLKSPTQDPHGLLRRIRSDTGETTSSRRTCRRATWCSTWGPRTPRPTAPCACAWSSTARPSSRWTPEIGFLHRGFQKSCENVTWTQALPYTDRLDYVSSLHNNFGFLNAVETLMGLEIPERAKYIRVIGAELHRIASHLTTAGALALELGGFSAFLYGIEARELITDRITELTGARLTTSFGRIGGLNRDLPPGWSEKVLKTLVKIEELAARGGRAALAQPHLHRPHQGHRGHHRATTRSTSASPAPACAPAA